MSKNNMAIFFIKPYIINQILLVYSTIHFRQCIELNDKNQSMLHCHKNIKYANKMNSQKSIKIRIISTIDLCDGHLHFIMNSNT